MLSVLNIRLASRLSPITKPAISQVARPVFASRSQTRSFWSSTHVEEPKKSTKPTAKKTGKAVKPEKKKRVDKKPATPKRVVIPKDARPPRAPATSYLFFFKEYLKEHGLDAQDPSMRKQDALLVSAGKAGKAWKAMSDEQKAPYIEQARVEREKYVEKRDEWLKQADPAIIRELNKKSKQKLRKPKLPGEPTRPVPPFFMYLLDRKASIELNAGMDSMRQLASDSGKEWASMTEEQKKPYQERFDQLSKEYKEQKAAFLASK